MNKSEGSRSTPARDGFEAWFNEWIGDECGVETFDRLRRMRLTYKDLVHAGWKGALSVAPSESKPFMCPLRREGCKTEGRCLHPSVASSAGGAISNATGPTGYAEAVSNAYTPDQQRVADWIFARGLGGGEDPIGFLLTSYEYVIAERNALQSATVQISDRRLR